VSSHTPGPWSVINRTEVESEDHKIADCYVLLGEHERELWEPVPDEQMDANTRLIAAAPELLEALETLVDAYEQEEGVCFCPDCEEAKAAIKSAKGEDDG